MTPAPKAPPPRAYTEAELADLRGESKVAKAMGLRWQDRGPPPDQLPEGLTTWRGQQYRPKSGKWANRGGENKEWYTAYYKAKQQGKEVERLFLENNPHPKKKK